MEISPRAIRDTIATVNAPSPADAGDYRIATSVGQAFLARSRSGAPTLLIPLSLAPTGVGRRGGGFTLTPAARVAFDYAGRRWEQAAAALECTDVQVEDAFFVLVVDIARRLSAASGTTGWPTVLTWVEEWQTLLGRRSVMTPEQQLGLWGELWIVSSALDPDSLLAAWRGPDREAIDFLFDGIGLEVKVSRRPHVHHVSQRQVERPVGMHDSYLLSIWVGPEPVRGIALSELIDGLLTRVVDGPALLRRIALLGYSPLDRDQYAVRFIPLEMPRWFGAEAVPRVREIDPGVSQVRYVVSLDIDKAVDPENAHALWRHFCQREPSIDASNSL